jgi:hypothetical protein
MKNDTNVDNQELKTEKSFVFDENNCPVMATMSVVGGKWKVILINRIYFDSPARFGALKRCLKGISQTMLTSQLRELEEAGIISRKIYAEIPPRVEYTLTEFGLTLGPIIKSMADWGIQHKLNKETLGKGKKKHTKI